MRVSKGALIVMRRRKVDSLYILQGATIIDAAIVSSSKDSDSNS